VFTVVFPILIFWRLHVACFLKQFFSAGLTYHWCCYRSRKVSKVLEFSGIFKPLKIIENYCRYGKVWKNPGKLWCCAGKCRCSLHGVVKLSGITQPNKSLSSNDVLVVIVNTIANEILHSVPSVRLLLLFALSEILSFKANFVYIGWKFNLKK